MTFRTCENCHKRHSTVWSGLLRLAICPVCMKKLDARIARDRRVLGRILERLKDGKSIKI